jgi:outer membrane protein
MKNLSLIINGILAAALVVAFILIFSLRSKVNEMESSSGLGTSVGGGDIVFVNMDSLNLKYDYYTDVKAEMEGKRTKMEAELKQKNEVLERAAMEYQEKMQKGLLLRSEAEKIEMKLRNDQQNLMSISQNMQAQLAEESQVMNRKLFNTITDYLKEFNKNGKYQYIMSHGFGGNLLYTNDSLDITSKVLNGLNKKYQAEKK